MLSQLLEDALAINQVQTRVLVAFELASLRYQTWESACKDLLREAGTGAAGGDDRLNERSLFLGVKSLRSSAAVMPELEDSVAKELAARAAVLKGRRKAREEAAPSKGLGPQTAPAATAKKGAEGSKGRRAEGLRSPLSCASAGRGAPPSRGPVFRGSGFGRRGPP